MRVASWCFLIAGLLAVLAVPGARAQNRFWAIDTNVCTSDGTRCIKGIMVNNGPPFSSEAECIRHAQALMRQYVAARMRVSYIRCVPISG